MLPLTNSLKEKIHILTLGDKLLIGALLMVGFLGLFVYPGVQLQGTFGVVESGGDVAHRLDLSSDQEVTVLGPLGKTVVEVKDGRVRVKESPCPHKLCVNMGFKKKDGDVIACIPNRVAVHIEGSKSPEAIDGVTR